MALDDPQQTELACLRDKKADLRRSVLARRNAMSVSARATAANGVRARLLTLLNGRPGPVSGFLPIRSEIDITQVLDDLVKAGREICLPVVLGADTLEFRRHGLDMELVDAGFGTRGPGASAARIDPAVLLVPLSAFDRSGARLGYGAGHYDRALARLDATRRVLAVGVGFALQEVPTVPSGCHDRRLDIIVTDSETIRCGDAPCGS